MRVDQYVSRENLRGRFGSVAVIVTQTNRPAAMQGEPAARLGNRWTAGPGHKQPPTRGEIGSGLAVDRPNVTEICDALTGYNRAIS